MADLTTRQGRYARTMTRLADARISLELAVRVSSVTLTYAPVVGRRTFYACLSIGARRFWVQRWETRASRDHTVFAYSRDGLMCWTRGVQS